MIPEEDKDKLVIARIAAAISQRKSRAIVAGF